METINYLLDVHTHTIASGHAYSTMNEMLLAAAEKGLEILGITEHAPQMPGSCQEFYFHNMVVVPREKYGVKLLLGAELNIMDYEGAVDLTDRELEKLDIAIASLHTPCIRPGTMEENTNALVTAMQHPHIHIIGHPDDGRYPLDYETLVKAARDSHVLLEVNNNSLSPRSFRSNTFENDAAMLRYCKQYEVPVIIGSDAHIDVDVGTHENALKVLEETDFPWELVVNGQPKLFLSYING